MFKLRFYYADARSNEEHTFEVARVYEEKHPRGVSRAILVQESADVRERKLLARRSSTAQDAGWTITSPTIPGDFDLDITQVAG